MSSRPDPAQRPSSEGTAPFWPVPLARAVPALASGLAVTFLADHSPRIGLFALGALALVGGLVVAILGRPRVADRTAGRILTAQGLLSAVIGAVAIALGFTSVGIATLLLVATLFAALTGVLELYLGLRSRSTPVGRDWLTVGAGTMVFALALLIIPADSVLAVGLIGAYGVVLGMYLVIAALSLKWAAGVAEHPTTEPRTAAEPTTGATP